LRRCASTGRSVEALTRLSAPQARSDAGFFLASYFAVFRSAIEMIPDYVRADTHAHAAALLIADTAINALSAADARTVVSYMQFKWVPAGEIIVQEGAVERNDLMALVIHGEVTVENTVAPRHEGMVISVIGPGELIGQMGIIDGSAHSVTCTTVTDAALAVLTREAMIQLMTDHPTVMARLQTAMFKRLADHLRDTNHKVVALTQVNKALRHELDAAHAANLRLLDKAEHAGRVQEH
jgi:CRP-like cAMP-binding protein